MKKEVRTPDEGRLAVLARIAEYERNGWFDRDVEDDPEGSVLHPEDIKYLNRSPLARVKRSISFGLARLYFHTKLENKQLYLDPPEGIEHLAGVSGGVVITANHFHPFDSFFMQRVFDLSGRRGRMYRVIREGNYTAFPGFYGMLMRNCDTLPLSSDPATMKRFLAAAYRTLSEGNALLIYAEQSLWWNYRKPKPLKTSAFEIAYRRGVPVVPCFITFADTEKIGEDGFPVLRYTPHLGAPISPLPDLPKKEAIADMKERNEAFCRATYERVYGIPLVYETQK